MEFRAAMPGITSFSLSSDDEECLFQTTRADEWVVAINRAATRNG